MHVWLTNTHTHMTQRKRTEAQRAHLFEIGRVLREGVSQHANLFCESSFLLTQFADLGSCCCRRRRLACKPLRRQPGG